MKKYAYLIALVLLSFSCNKNIYPSVAEAEEAQEQQCPPQVKQGFSVWQGIASGLLITTIIFSISHNHN